MKLSATKSLSIMEANQAEQPKKSFWKTLGKVAKVAAVLLILLSKKDKVRGEVGTIAKDVDPEFIESL